MSHSLTDYAVHHADQCQPIFFWKSETDCWFGLALKYAEGLTQAIVRELLDYDPVTGVLTHRRRDRRWFESDRIWKSWNSRYAGRPAFTAINYYRYLFGAIFCKNYLAHRIIWLWMTGRWPNDEIDHDNHLRADNRWVNLFEKTSQQNAQNQSLPITNTSGRIGVYWHEDKGKFYAQIKVDGRHLWLGYHNTFEEACAARAAAEVHYGFHKNHGAVAGSGSV